MVRHTELSPKHLVTYEQRHKLEIRKEDNNNDLLYNGLVTRETSIEQNKENVPTGNENINQNENESISLEASQQTNQSSDGIKESTNKHQLWVNLSSLGEGNVFALLPRLLEKMFNEQNKLDEEDQIFEITLPSDYEWRTRIYVKMLEKKRRDQESNMDGPLPDEGTQVLHHWNIIPKEERDRKSCSAATIEKFLSADAVYGPGPITWTVKDIAIAGCLLSKPPLPTDFEDEQEMRRVYKLIYDVFRYKSILNRALNDIGFFVEHRELRDSQSRIWLLLYDLYHRSFKKRETSVVKQATKLFAESGLTDLEKVLWENRVKIAAAISRIRIKHSALRLNDLLPNHLKDEKISTSEDKSPVSCWANVKKSKNMDEITNSLVANLGLTLVDPKATLSPETFKWDTHCPQFLLFHPSVRTKLAQSNLVKKFRIVVQDRSFCLGPAAFGRIVEELQLTGSVIQSHVNSPRTTAYLAALLSQNLKINKLLAFSAGEKKQEYDKYFQDLGMKNIMTYSEKLIDAPTDASYLEEVVAVFATPPNSYSAVNDPIDLVCSRGGDLSMLEALTEAEETKEGQQRVANILDEQRKTLRFAMSRPQIQLVLYETHSELEVENGGMIQKAMKEVNKVAKVHHAQMQGKNITAIPLETLVDGKEINNNEKLSAENLKMEDDNGSTSQLGSATSLEVEEDLSEQKYKDVIIPETDIFDVPKLPDLCPIPDICLDLSNEGCFLALLQRKKVTRLDNKYMIEMAESRGLFGNTTSGKGKNGKGVKTKKQDKPPTPTPKKKKSKIIEMERIMAPTLSSTLHSKISCSEPQCLRCRQAEEAAAKVPQSRRWWNETTRHLTNLRTSLVKQKILPPAKKTHSQPVAKLFVNTLINTTCKIDELVIKTNTQKQIPVYPKLRLTRHLKKKEKIRVPVSVTLVQFPMPTMY